MQLTECHITLDGKNYYYWTSGNKSKPPMFFLHGFLGNHEGLIWLAEFFQHDYYIIMPDFPACGKSESLGVKTHGLKTYADWLGDFLQATNIQKPILVGHSFGARVATYFSAHYQDQVSAVVLLTPVIKVEKFWAHMATWGYKVARLMPLKLRRKYLANAPYQHFVFWLMFKSSDKEKKAKIIQDSLAEARSINLDVMLEMFEDFYVGHDFEKMAKQIAIPCLLVAGMKDHIVSVSSVQSFVGSMKQAKLEIVENTGHMLPIEYPNYTAQTIQAWLHSLQSL